MFLTFGWVGDSAASLWDSTLANNSKRLHDWVHSVNVSHSMSFYLFNVTNEELKKPTLAQVGPFKFSEKREINVIGHEDHERLLVFSMRKFYHYIDEGADLDQSITVLNIPLMVSF